MPTYFIFILHTLEVKKSQANGANVPSKLCDCAAEHVAKKRRAAVSNCRTVIFNVICVIYISWESSPLWTLDFGLESGDWM